MFPADVFSLVGSHIFTAQVRWPGLLAQIRQRIVHLRMPDYTKRLLAGRPINKAYPIGLPTLNFLGMSGALYAAVAVMAMSAGDENIHLFFILQLEVSAPYASPGLATLDILEKVRCFRHLQ